ncbi:hypothetical protein TDMWS_20190 [Thermodesulfomicrobium sp. WS]|uniref:regulator of G-protein signaling domain-containing protein n=1 Tax=Thermodesulfomicrobium sp. WS TaxID=3004129 RepID=UPI0024927085|nr:regulator of G-protein signaling domain-containing protein [Thermodesulfomicrobium sp. WS]BDV01934.1 hypothetical protein TDMWS_20190 [Thermodesulfomicrobium sp. WS]
MPTTVDQFRSIAQTGGYLRHEAGEDSRLQRYGRGLFGKIVAWFRAKFHPGTVAAENRQVMQSFVTALRDCYGEYSTTLAKDLDLSGATPLSARTVRSLIQAGEKHRSQIAGYNKLIQEQFSVSNLFGRRDFGKVWYDIVAEKGIRQGFSVEDFHHERLSLSIAAKIKWASEQGTRMVSEGEAEHIARREVEQFITRKQALLEHIGTMGLNERQQAVLTELVKKNEDITSQEQLDAIWQTHEAATAFINRLRQDPPPSRLEVLETFHTLSTVCYEHTKPLAELAKKQSQEFGGDNLMAMREYVIQLGMGLAGIQRDDAARIFHLLSSDAVKEMQKVLVSFLSGEFMPSPSEEIQSTNLNLLREVTLIIAGKRIGKSEEDIQRALTVSEAPTHMRDIPGDLFDALKSLGFDLYRADDPLSGILQSERGFEDFVTFSEKKQAEENPLFWKAVENFRGITDEEKKQEAARAIVDDFIKPGGPHEINIDGAERQAILDAVAENRLDGVFDRAQDHILTLMEQNFHQDFAQWFAGQQ